MIIFDFSNTTLDNYGYTSMDWSLEGYQLWLGTSNGNLHLINIVKSIQVFSFTINYNSILKSIHDAMVFVGSDRIFVCPTTQDEQIASHLIWQLIKPPHGYITTNWPIKVVNFFNNLFILYLSIIARLVVS